MPRTSRRGGPEVLPAGGSPSALDDVRIDRPWCGRYRGSPNRRRAGCGRLEAPLLLLIYWLLSLFFTPLAVWWRRGEAGMRRMMAPFSDRQDAGRRLAERLAPLRAERPVVLALPRGGVPVGYEIARALGAPLDVIVARKLGAPHQPEFGIGAIAPGGVRLLDWPVVEALGIPPAELDRIAAAETAEMERRLREFRDDLPPLDVAGRVVIVVDDGLATGVTARAAVAAVRAQRPARVVLAAPVCSPEAARALGAEADEVVCLATPPEFRAVGLWYEDFEQTSDAEVIALLRQARRHAPAAAGGEDPGDARPAS